MFGFWKKKKSNDDEIYECKPLWEKQLPGDLNSLRFSPDSLTYRQCYLDCLDRELKVKYPYFSLEVNFSNEGFSPTLSVVLTLKQLPELTPVTVWGPVTYSYFNHPTIKPLDEDHSYLHKELVSYLKEFCELYDNYRKDDLMEKEEYDKQVREEKYEKLSDAFKEEVG